MFLCAEFLGIAQGLSSTFTLILTLSRSHTKTRRRDCALATVSDTGHLLDPKISLRIGRHASSVRGNVAMTNHDEAESRASLTERAVAPQLDALLAPRTALAKHFQHFQNAFHEEGCIDPRLLELCRARLDALHGMPSRSTLDGQPAQCVARGDFAELTAVERQALSLCEQLAIDAHGVSDQQVAAVAEHLGEAATVSLLTAVSMHDASIRMELVLQAARDIRVSTTD